MTDIEMNKSYINKFKILTGKLLVLSLLTFIIFGLCPAVKAQDLPGKPDSVHSNIFHKNRLMQIVLPAGYKFGSAAKYDVLYVLDEGNTQLVADMQRYLQDEGYVPPIIIVGIVNDDRTRDFTPTPVAGYDNSGGADKFLSFFKDELVPFVDKSYPSSGHHIIFGHSFGGLFVFYALLNAPKVFDAYIAADPSLWWGHGYMDTLATRQLPGLAGLNRTLYICGREGVNYTTMGIVSMTAILQKDAPTDFLWKDQAYPDETHTSLRLKGIYDGLKFAYAGFSTQTMKK